MKKERKEGGRKRTKERKKTRKKRDRRGKVTKGTSTVLVTV